MSSLSPTAHLGLYCLFAFLAALAGGWLPALFHFNHTRLQVAVSFVAGLMLGLALLHLLPHGAEELGSMTAGTGWLMGGFIGMFLLQRFLPFHHHDIADAEPAHACGHDHSPAGMSARHLGWVSVAIGLSLHSIIDGLALAAAAVSAKQGHGEALALGTALAVILHKPFSALAITTLMTASGTSLKWLNVVNTAFALVTPLGAILFFAGAGHLAEDHPAWLGAALAFCAGTFLCIACADLLPELQFHAHDRVKLSLALLAGVGVAVLIGKFAHPPHDEHHDHDHAGQSRGSLIEVVELRGGEWFSSRAR
ncbi:MAG: ZIP family metal transporter [Limisphaerales bacterium]